VPVLFDKTGFVRYAREDGEAVKKGGIIGEIYRDNDSFGGRMTQF
jgi:hypothetical protein